MNLVATKELGELCPGMPSLFCGDVRAEGCKIDDGLPAWLYCREANCDACGFSVRYPACPTVEALPAITCRVLSSATRYLEWVVEGEVGEEPPRKKQGETDQLVEVKLPGAVFLRYMGELMDKW